MSRPVSPQNHYTIKPHRVGIHCYASTQPPQINLATGRKIYRYVHWGKIIENKFFPGKQYLQASQEERARLIFPAGMDLSALEELKSSTESAGAADSSTQSLNSTSSGVSGDIWLLLACARHLKLNDDLRLSLDAQGSHQNAEVQGDEGADGLVKLLLELGAFCCLNQGGLHHPDAWLKSQLHYSADTKSALELCKRITDETLTRFHELRIDRLNEHELCALASCRRPQAHALMHISRQGFTIPDNGALTVFTTEEHLPLTTVDIPGFFPNFANLQKSLYMLAKSGCSDILLIGESGFEDLANLGKLLSKGQRLLIRLGTWQNLVLRTLPSGDSRDIPPQMQPLEDTGLYCRHLEVPAKLKGPDGQKLTTELHLTLLLDPALRERELCQIKNALDAARRQLETEKKRQTAFEEPENIRQRYPYFKLRLDPQSGQLREYTLDEARLNKLCAQAGYLAMLTAGTNLNAQRQLELIKLHELQRRFILETGSNAEDQTAAVKLIRELALALSAYLEARIKKAPALKALPDLGSLLDTMREAVVPQEALYEDHAPPLPTRQQDIVKALGFIKEDKKSDKEEEHAP